MNELLYEYGAKFSWYITLLFGIFLMIFGIDVVISLVESYNVFLVIFVSGIYGFGMILILIGVLGILLVRRYGRKGDLILRWSIFGILAILAMIPIVFFISYDPYNLRIIGVICAIYLFIFLFLSILEQKRFKQSHNPNPEDDLRFIGNIFSIIRYIFSIIIGIIIAGAGFIVNGFFSELFPSIYKLGSYGFAFMFAGGVILISVIFQYNSEYEKRKKIKEKKQLVSKKREEFNAEWFNHQYYGLGRSIQEIANELDESVMSTRKRLDDLGYSKELNGAKLSVKKSIQRNKIESAAKIEKKKIDTQKREWFKHQYYDLGKSIQDIANELDESVISTRKRFEDIESKKELV